MFDWNPRGTLPPAEWDNREEWNPRNYFWNYGQKVTTEDANAMGDAINWAVDMLQDTLFEASFYEQFGDDWENQMIHRLKVARLFELKDPAFIFFDIRWEEKLMELVYFCRQGEFAIY